MNSQDIFGMFTIDNHYQFMKIVFCCIGAWIQRDISDCQQDFQFLFASRKLTLNQNVWRDHTTMQQDVLLHFGWHFHIEISLKYEKKIFCCPALELFHCLPLWKTVLFVSSSDFSLSTPTFSLSTPVNNSEATWKKATKCNKILTYKASLKQLNCKNKMGLSCD